MVAPAHYSVPKVKPPTPHKLLVFSKNYFSAIDFKTYF